MWDSIPLCNSTSPYRNPFRFIKRGGEAGAECSEDEATTAPGAPPNFLCFEAETFSNHGQL